METSLPLTYLVILVALLAGASVLVIRQVLKTRASEVMLSNLQRKITQGPGTAQDYYELASLLLDKKIYSQAIANLQKSIKSPDFEEGPNAALVYNALGYAYTAQEQYDLAIRQYKEALKQSPQYVIALNNLAFAYERKQLTTQALDLYDQVLAADPTNATAKKRSESLRKRITPNTAKTPSA